MGRLLGTLLLGQELIDPEQLDLALAELPSSGLRLGDILLRSGLLNERQLTEGLAEQYGVTVIDLSRQARTRRSPAA